MGDGILKMGQNTGIVKQPVSQFELPRALPENLKSSLSSIEELEAELSEKEYISDEKYLQTKTRGGINERFTVN